MKSIKIALLLYGLRENYLCQVFADAGAMLINADLKLKL